MNPVKLMTFLKAAPFAAVLLIGHCFAEDAWPIFQKNERILFQGDSITDANVRANTPEEVCAAIQVICDRLLAKSPSSRVVVMGVFPRGFSPDDPQRALHRKLNELLAAALAGRPQLTFLDIRGKLLQPDGSLSRDISFDGTHPTDKGYAIWGQALADAGVVDGKLQETVI